MNNEKQVSAKEAFKIWVPDSSPWSSWAKPVLFTGRFRGSVIRPKPAEIKEISGYRFDTAVIIDMPGEAGVWEGLFLAELGYRPVPLYNGVCETGANMTVKVRDVQAALFGAAPMLENLRISKDAAPVFLLDSRRFEEQEMQYGKYDNRWRVFPQDMPSAAFMSKNGITTVIVRTARIDDDLSHILYRYKQAGLKIMLCTDDKIQEASVDVPSKFKGLGYRFISLFKTRRNTAGGFGASVGELKTGGYYGGMG